MAGPSSPFKTTLRWVLRFVALGIIPLLFIQLNPLSITLFQLLQSFLVQTMIGSIIILIPLSFWLKERVALSIFTVVVLIVSVKAYPYYWPFSVDEEAPEITVGHYNLWFHNPDISSAIQQIKTQDANIIGIQELNLNWLDQLEILKDSHPYSFVIPSDTCCYGIGVYSKFPITYQEAHNIDETIALELDLDVRGKRLKVLYLHTRPPAFPDQSQSRNKQLRQFSQRAKRSRNNWIFMGDLNIVPWANEFREALKISEGKDARRGLNANFPADYWPLIPIDHVVHSQNLKCVGFHSVDIDGADHCGLYAGFRVLDEQ